MDGFPTFHQSLTGVRFSIRSVESACSRSTMSSQMNYDWNSSTSDISSCISAEQPNDWDSEDGGSPRISGMHMDIPRLVLSPVVENEDDFLGETTGTELRALNYRQRGMGESTNGLLRSKRHAIYGEPTNPVLTKRSRHAILAEPNMPTITESSDGLQQLFRSVNYYVAVVTEDSPPGDNKQLNGNSSPVIRSNSDNADDVMPAADATTPTMRIFTRLINSLRRRKF